MRSFVAIAILCATASAAPVPKEVKNGFECKGVWEVVAINAYGNELEFTPGCKWSLDKSGNMVQFVGEHPLPDATFDARYAFHSDRTVEYLFGEGKGVYPGAFEIDGDTVTICCNLKGGIRPKSMGAGAVELDYQARSEGIPEVISCLYPTGRRDLSGDLRLQADDHTNDSA